MAICRSDSQNASHGPRRGQVLDAEEDWRLRDFVEEVKVQKISKWFVDFLKCAFSKICLKAILNIQ